MKIIRRRFQVLGFPLLICKTIIQNVIVWKRRTSGCKANIAISISVLVNGSITIPLNFLRWNKRRPLHILGNAERTSSRSCGVAVFSFDGKSKGAGILNGGGDFEGNIRVRSIWRSA